jgi:predicted DNA-binding transcriptional regulator AlpA
VTEPAPLRLAGPPAPNELETENPLDRQLDRLQDTPRQVNIVPEQVAADTAAAMAGVSQSSWWRLHAGEKVPRPNKLGGRTLWRVDELKRWIEAGCPCRRIWEAKEAVRIGRK